MDTKELSTKHSEQKVDIRINRGASDPDLSKPRRSNSMIPQISIPIDQRIRTLKHGNAKDVMEV